MHLLLRFCSSFANFSNNPSTSVTVDGLKKLLFKSAACCTFQTVRAEAQPFMMSQMALMGCDNTPSQMLTLFFLLSTPTAHQRISFSGTLFLLLEATNTGLIILLSHDLLTFSCQQK